jgi:hypothetical protein
MSAIEFAPVNPEVLARAQVLRQEVLAKAFGAGEAAG